MSDRVCAVVVTFNRKDLLRHCLQGLMGQTRPLDLILVVNNASADGTAEMVATEFPQVKALNQTENLGGAGGFHAGMKWAYGNGYDWMWLMDDDVEPLPGALERMLLYRDRSEFIHCRKVTPEGPFVWESIWDVHSMIPFSLPEDISFKNGKDWMCVNYATFEGGLVHRHVVESIGLPDPDFFILGDDAVYGFLASFHTNVIYVNHTGLTRQLPRPDDSPFQLYFRFRNIFLIRKYLQAVGVSFSPVLFWIHIAADVLWRLRNNAPARTISGMKMIAKGLWDGTHRSFGRPAWL